MYTLPSSARSLESVVSTVPLVEFVLYHPELFAQLKRTRCLSALPPYSIDAQLHLLIIAPKGRYRWKNRRDNHERGVVEASWKINLIGGRSPLGSHCLQT